MNRREFIQLLSLAGVGCSTKKKRWNFEQIPNFGNVRLLHISDTHAQLLPIYFREPSINIGVGRSRGQVPHLVGQAFLNKFSIIENSLEAHAFTALNFSEAAELYGKVGGYAYLKSLIDKLRGEFGQANTLLLDGGDTWQGSATAYWTQGQDMVEASNRLGVDIMTGHWEFTYGQQQVMENIKAFQGEFLAHNVKLTEEALFNDVEAYDQDTGHVFKPYTIKRLQDKRIAIIGQAFPYTPIAHPKRLIPDWTFGLQRQALQTLVNNLRDNESVDAVILLSHNGMDVDLKMAAEITGIDVILGGHTHDAVPIAVEINNAKGITLVTNAGSHGKFVGVLDLKVGQGRIIDYRYQLIPVFSHFITPDKQMADFINKLRHPYQQRLQQTLAIAGDQPLYRRGNFNGTFDQVICNAQRLIGDAEISLSPGFRWGTTVLSGDPITMERVMDQTAITYPETYVKLMRGAQIKSILEDVCDNLFNPNPYYQQGGDMVRVGGLNYVCDPSAKMGQRISELTLDNGALLNMNKNYKVAGWATVGKPSSGIPIWDVVAEYLRDCKVVSIDRLNLPQLKNI